MKTKPNNIKALKDSSLRGFFLAEGIENCCYPELKPIFETLLLQKKVKQQALADYLQLDKAYVSRMVNGLIIPPLRIRLKVAQFFNVDSALIWRFLPSQGSEVPRSSLASSSDSGSCDSGDAGGCGE